MGEEKFVEEMVKDDFHIHQKLRRDESTSKESTPSDQILENLDEEFVFPNNDDDMFAEDGTECMFMTSKEAYRRENPMHAVLVPPSANNHNPWTIHNKMKEEVERQRALIENLRIRQIQEEEEEFARAQTAQVIEEMQEQEEMKEEKFSDKEADDDESFEEPVIDYSQWTIGTRADILDSPLSTNQPFS